VSEYTITITPHGDAGDAAGPQTTVRVATGTGAPRITELIVRAAEGAGLQPGQLPALDLDLLVRALTPAGTPVIEAHTPPAPDEPPTASEPPTATEATEPPTVPAPPSARKAARKATARKATASAAKRTGARKAAATDAKRKATARKATASAAKRTGARKAAATDAKRAAAKKQAAAADNGRRPYRRMPETADVVTAYERLNSVTKLAEHFQVPRYTAQAWISRLRQQGELRAPRARRR